MGASSSVPATEPPLTYFERETKTLHQELVNQRERDHFTKEQANLAPTRRPREDPPRGLSAPARGYE